MADKSISELVAATAVGSTDLFVLEQTGTAKKLTGQILENWLVAMADGHGGIQTIAKTGTSGLVDTYTITYADTTTSTFTVTNGKAITSITQYWAVSTSGSTVPSQWYTTRQTMTPTNKYLWSYMTITYNDSTTEDTTKSVVGVYGDTGAQTYVWIKYAAIQPTSDADMGDVPDNWIGIYSGTSSTAPTHYTDYTWYQYKGAKGDTGDASEITTQSVTYLESASGTVVPSGSWTQTVPSVTPGNFLWTRTILTFNDNTTVTAYSVSRYGIDGTGSVSTVNNVSPDANGNIALTATDVPTSNNTSVQTHIDGIESGLTAVNNRFRNITSGNLADITTPGVYYITTAVSGKPTTATGGVYIVGAFDAGAVTGIYVNEYDDRVFHIRVINGTLSYTELAVPTKVTVTGTTTGSGALAVPSAYSSYTFLSATMISESGFVFRRDPGYFTVMNNDLTPKANKEVSFTAVFIY